MLFSKKYALLSGVNGEIEYDIIKGDPYAVFKIDKSTGSISVGKQLDYEQIPVYNIVIQAQDRGFYPKSATSSVKIILLDVNDNPPTFDETLFEAVLKENSPPGTFVTQMIANDLDSPKNADISYGKIFFELPPFLAFVCLFVCLVHAMQLDEITNDEIIETKNVLKRYR